MPYHVEYSRQNLSTYHDSRNKRSYFELLNYGLLQLGEEGIGEDAGFGKIEDMARSETSFYFYLSGD
jgi:hypothetical protein